MKQLSAVVLMLAPVVFLVCVAGRLSTLSKLTAASLGKPDFMDGTVKLSTSPVPEGADYPASLALRPVGEGDAAGGPQVLGAPGELRGRFCWVGQREEGEEQAVPVVERLEVAGGAWKRQRWELPAYNRRIWALGFPLWKNSRERCLVRAARRNSDVGSYRLYALDLQRGVGAAGADPLYLHDRLEVEPSGQRHAFNTADPWSNQHYQLAVAGEGYYRLVSSERATEDFSWSARGSLLYSGYPKKREITKHRVFPIIYEDNLKGRVSLVKEGARAPLLSPDGKYLACIESDGDFKPLRGQTERSDLTRDERALLCVFALKSKQKTILARVADPRAVDSIRSKYLWARGGRLCVAENFYDYRQRLASYRIRVYDARSKRYTLTTTLTQAGESAARDDQKLRPFFTPIKIANGRFLLLHVATATSGDNNFRVIAVDLESSARRDILTFTSPLTPYHIPMLDWADA
jgi:hypothetical protein